MTYSLVGKEAGLGVMQVMHGFSFQLRKQCLGHLVFLNICLLYYKMEISCTLI